MDASLDALARYVLSHWKYDPKTGAVLGSQGKPIGVRVRGYLNGSVRLGGTTRVVGLHRVAWLFAHGRWPTDQIDHRDGDRSNNRIANLREATNQQNAENKRPRRRTQQLPPGVYATDHGRFMVQRRHLGALHYAGTFVTEAEAATASLALKARLHQFNPEQRAA